MCTNVKHKLVLTRDLTPERGNLLRGVHQVGRFAPHRRHRAAVGCCCCCCRPTPGAHADVSLTTGATRSSMFTGSRCLTMMFVCAREREGVVSRLIPQINPSWQFSADTVVYINLEKMARPTRLDATNCVLLSIDRSPALPLNPAADVNTLATCH